MAGNLFRRQDLTLCQVAITLVIIASNYHLEQEHELCRSHCTAKKQPFFVD